MGQAGSGAEGRAAGEVGASGGDICANVKGLALWRQQFGLWILRALLCKGALILTELREDRFAHLNGKRVVENL